MRKSVIIIVSLFVMAILSPVVTANAAGYWKLLNVKVMKPTGQPGFSFVDSGPQGILMKWHPDKNSAIDIKCDFHQAPKELVPNTNYQLVLTYNNIRISNPKKYAVGFFMSATWDSPDLGPGTITGGATRVGSGTSNLVQGAVVTIPAMFKVPVGSGKRSIYKSCGYGTTASTYTLEYQYSWVNK